MSLIKLKFLTNDEENLRLCKLYWEVNVDGKFTYSVTNLARTFNIPSQGLSRTVSEYCVASTSQIKCLRCGNEYIFENRSDFQKRLNSHNSSWLCETCRIEKEAEELKAKQAEQEYQRKIIRNTFNSSSKKPVDLKQISFEEAVSLLSLTRLCATEDFKKLTPLWSVKQSLGPNEVFQYDLIRQLYKNNIIHIHPESPPDAFIFEGDKVTSIYLERVIWMLPPSPTTSEPSKFVEELEKIFLNMDWADTWFNQRLDFCKRIAVEECLQYLKVCLEDHGFSLSPGEKTYLVINNLLEDFSVGQIYSFIWRAAKDAAAFYVRERVPKQHAANTVVGSIQRQAERARAEGWEIKPYRRDFRCPQSMISEVLYNAVLHIGEDGFNKPLK